MSMCIKKKPDFDWTEYYFVTCSECDYYSFEIKSLAELKTMEYPEIDYGKDGVYHLEIGRLDELEKYHTTCKATVYIEDCRCVSATLHITQDIIL